jgi:hypothetical protein
MADSFLMQRKEDRKMAKALRGVEQKDGKLYSWRLTMHGT